MATTACASGACVPSRWFRVAADAGATSVTMQLDQIHADHYRGTAVLDRNGDFATTRLPGTGDGVSVPDTEIDVAASGVSSAAVRILFDL